MTMATEIEGQKISQLAEKTQLDGQEQIPVAHGGQNYRIGADVLKAFIASGLLKVEEDQHGDPVVILPEGTKIAAYRPDGTFQTLIYYAEYENGEKQNEVGAANTHLNLNTDNTVTVDTPDGKKTLVYQENLVVASTWDWATLLTDADQRYSFLEAAKPGDLVNNIAFTNPKTQTEVTVSAVILSKYDTQCSVFVNTNNTGAIGMTLIVNGSAANITNINPLLTGNTAEVDSIQAVTALPETPDDTTLYFIVPEEEESV